MKVVCNELQCRCVGSVRRCFVPTHECKHTKRTRLISRVASTAAASAATTATTASVDDNTAFYHTTAQLRQARQDSHLPQGKAEEASRVRVHKGSHYCCCCPRYPTEQHGSACIQLRGSQERELTCLQKNRSTARSAAADATAKCYSFVLRVSGTFILNTSLVSSTQTSHLLLIDEAMCNNSSSSSGSRAAASYINGFFCSPVGSLSVPAPSWASSAPFPPMIHHSILVPVATQPQPH